MNILPRYRCLSLCTQIRRSFQTPLVRLLFLGLTLIVGTIRGHAQTITKFTAESTVVNGIRQYVGHITLSNIRYVYVTGNIFGLGPGGHWVPVPIPITLSSADPALAQAPSSVTVGPNSPSVSFPITTTPVSADTVVGITATCLKSSLTANLVVRAPVLSGLTFHPPTVAYYTRGSVLVTLDSPAPASGVTVTLVNNIPNLFHVPALVTVPAGAASVAVPFTVDKLTGLIDVGLSATLGGVTLNADVRLVLFLPFDFNNDGQNDLLIQNSATGDVGVWLLNGTTVLGGSYFNVHTGPDWTLAGTTEFATIYQRDPARALVFQNSTDGRVVFVYTDGPNILDSEAATAVPAPGYQIVGTGDFDRNLSDDLVFQNRNTHEIVIWLMYSSTVTGGVTIPTVPAAGWNVVGVGDFNHDGWPDLLFQNTVTGQLAVWYMNGTKVIGSGVISTIPPAGWQVKGVADYDNDGVPDIVFQTGPNSSPAIWFMNGLSITGSALLSAPLPAPYRIAGPH